MTFGDTGIVLPFLMAYSAIVMIMFAIAIGIYVWTSILLQRALTYVGHPKPWAAWVPYYRYYVLSELCNEKDGNVTIFGYKVRADLFNLWILFALLVSFIPVIGQFAAIVLQWICGYYCYSVLFARIKHTYVGDSNIIIGAILAILIPLALPILLMTTYNTTGVDPLVANGTIKYNEMKADFSCKTAENQVNLSK